MQLSAYGVPTAILAQNVFFLHETRSCGTSGGVDVPQLRVSYQKTHFEPTLPKEHRGQKDVPNNFLPIEPPKSQLMIENLALCCGG